MRKIPVIPILLLVALGAVWLLSQRPTGTGVDGYSGIKKEYARNAIYKAKTLANEDLNPSGLLALAYRVIHLERCPQHPPTCGPPVRRDGVLHENPACEGEPFEAEVEMYTVFGLPFGKVNIDCGGTVGFASGERARS